jgi:hypothetical protein
MGPGASWAIHQRKQKQSLLERVTNCEPGPQSHGILRVSLVGPNEEWRPIKKELMTPPSRQVLVGVICIGAAVVTLGPARSARAVMRPPTDETSAPAASCTTAPYAYAGLFSNRTASGIEATLTTIGTAQVTKGHVAGWIGVGGLNAGPKGKAEWLQVGLATLASGKTVIYAESTTPGKDTVYQALASNVVAGTPYRVAVRELPNRPDFWQISLNGRPVTAPVALPDSGHFEPMAMSESWNGGPPPTCSGFSYHFGQLKIASRSGVWSALTKTSPISNKGYKITHRTIDGFTASSG